MRSVAFDTALLASATGPLGSPPLRMDMPFRASGTSAARPAPAARPRAPDSGLEPFLPLPPPGVGMLPTFLAASRATVPNAPFKVSLMSLAICAYPSRKFCARYRATHRVAR